MKRGHHVSLVEEIFTVFISRSTTSRKTGQSSSKERKETTTVDRWKGIGRGEDSKNVVDPQLDSSLKHKHDSVLLDSDEPSSSFIHIFRNIYFLRQDVNRPLSTHLSMFVLT